MGGGRFSEESYVRSTSVRRSSGVSDFAYTETASQVHETLNPHRIRTKPFGLLESRDSVEHPESTPVIITFDVTGSNYNNAKVAQQKLPELMAKLAAVVDNPQVAVWANDDIYSVGPNAIQLGEFESDNRIDDTIRNIWLTGKGGGNQGESYDLLVYAAARKVVTDSFEKRHKKGYMFLYADEPFFTEVTAASIRTVFGDSAEADIPIASIIAEAQQKWNIFVLWPMNGFAHARAQYVTLFGADHVESLQDPNLLCDKVASVVAAQEAALVANGELAMASAGDDYGTRVE